MSYAKTHLKWSEVPQSNEKINKPVQKWIVLHFQTKSGELKHSKQLQIIGLYMATAQKRSALQSCYFNSLKHSLQIRTVFLVFIYIVLLQIVPYPEKRSSAVTPENCE